MSSRVLESQGKSIFEHENKIKSMIHNFFINENDLGHYDHGHDQKK